MSTATYIYTITIVVELINTALHKYYIPSVYSSIVQVQCNDAEHRLHDNTTPIGEHTFLFAPKSKSKVDWPTDSTCLNYSISIGEVSQYTERSKSETKPRAHLFVACTQILYTKVKFTGEFRSKQHLTSIGSIGELTTVKIRESVQTSAKVRKKKKDKHTKKGKRIRSWGSALRSQKATKI